MRNKLGLVRSYYDEIQSHHIEFKDVSLTQQEMADECDINNIVARFNRDGLVFVTPRRPEFGDFSSTDSYDVRLEKLAKARMLFDSLSDEDKKKYGNNVEEYLDSRLSELGDNYKARKAEADAKAKAEADERKFKEAEKLVASRGVKSDKAV